MTSRLLAFTCADDFDYDDDEAFAPLGPSPSPSLQFDFAPVSLAAVVAASSEDEDDDNDDQLCILLTQSIASLPSPPTPTPRSNVARRTRDRYGSSGNERTPAALFHDDEIVCGMDLLLPTHATAADIASAREYGRGPRDRRPRAAVTVRSQIVTPECLTTADIIRSRYELPAPIVAFATADAEDVGCHLPPTPYVSQTFGFGPVSSRVTFVGAARHLNRQQTRTDTRAAVAYLSPPPSSSSSSASLGTWSPVSPMMLAAESPLLLSSSSPPLLGSPLSPEKGQGVAARTRSRHASATAATPPPVSVAVAVAVRASAPLCFTLPLSPPRSPTQELAEMLTFVGLPLTIVDSIVTHSITTITTVEQRTRMSSSQVVRQRYLLSIPI
ncbi:hypothetical protein BC828DRAFT_371792 [Blastocladiella britannica]|nr:hypothetical protein BC828DRAFT_371792 [Blastocladiella britannica]